jgi:hypothetical protein
MTLRGRITPLLWIGLTLELILAAAAIWASISFLAEPDGSGLQMPVSWLAGTPFPDYFVPGLVLLAANGLLPLTVIALALVGHRWTSLAMMLSGVLLFGWLSIQLAMLRMLHPVMHPTLYAVSLALVAIGYLSWRRLAHPARPAVEGVGA